MFDAETLDRLAEEIASRVVLRLRPQAPRTNRDLLDIGEVAERLGQSTKTVRRLIDSGQLKAVHVNSKIQVRLATLEAFIELRERRN